MPNRAQALTNPTRCKARHRPLRGRMRYDSHHEVRAVLLARTPRPWRIRTSRPRRCGRGLHRRRAYTWRHEEIVCGASSAALDGVIPFAPPYLRAGKVVIAQTANITRYLGEQLGLAPASERDRLAASMIAMTIADLVAEVHDTHHPITSRKRTRPSAPPRSSAPRRFARSGSRGSPAGSSTRSRATARCSSARRSATSISPRSRSSAGSTTRSRKR